MENTALAFKPHTSGRLKNGSPLMWWLPGFSLKLGFRKKNELFRCVFFSWFYPYFLSFVAYIISLCFLPIYLNKIITYEIWAFFFLTINLFKLCESEWESSGHSWVYCRVKHMYIYFCTSLYTHVLCVYVPSLLKCCWGTRPSINPAASHY